MLPKQWLSGFATAGTITGVIAVGCGGSSTGGVGPAETGAADVTVEQGASDVQAEAALDAGGDGCDVDGDLYTYHYPDASIGDGGATTATCLVCLKADCTTEVATCDGDCACRGDIIAFITCLSTGVTPTGCLAMGAGQANTLAVLLGVCLETSCQAQCGAAGVFGEGGPQDAGGQ